MDLIYIFDALFYFDLLCSKDEIKGLSLFGFSQIGRIEGSERKGKFYNSYIVCIVYYRND